MTSEPLFELGRVFATASIASTVALGDILGLLARHVSGDFGELDEHDVRANN